MKCTVKRVVAVALTASILGLGMANAANASSAPPSNPAGVETTSSADDPEGLLAELVAGLNELVNQILGGAPAGT